MVNRIGQWLTIAVLTLGLSSALATATKAADETVVLRATGTAQNIDLHGYVRGSVALFKTVADRDVNRKRCFGYGSLTQDHILELQQATSQLTLQLKTRSHGSTTTLIVEDPDQHFYCADESPSGAQDAGMVLKNLKAGTYKVWVGTLDAGEARRYELNIQAQ